MKDTNVYYVGGSKGGEGEEFIAHTIPSSEKYL